MTRAPRENAFDPQCAADALLAARRSGAPLAALPPQGRPTNAAEAYAIQALVAKNLGPVVAWKVGAPSADATPARAPIHVASVYENVSTLKASLFRVVGLEAEIAFRLARDLAVRERVWTRAENLDAVGSVHPVFETLDTRFAAVGALDPLSHLSDQGSHGALIVGPAAAKWRGLDFAHEKVALDIDGERRVDAIGGNSAGDPVRLLEWLANDGARDFGGLKAGQIVTTGSCTGTIFVRPGARAKATFGHLGEIALAIV